MSFFLPVALSASVLITLPRTSRLLFMLQPSLSLSPVAPVEELLSLPARSTKLSIPLLVIFCFVWFTSRINIVCERLEY